MLTPKYRKNRVLAAREFLEHYKKQDEIILDPIVTVDET